MFSKIEFMARAYWTGARVLRKVSSEVSRLGRARGLTKDQVEAALDKASSDAVTAAIYRLRIGYEDVYSDVSSICEREVMRQVLRSN